MNHRLLCGVSSITSLLLGCGDILGLDDNKPSCACPAGQRCDERCVPVNTGSGGSQVTGKTSVQGGTTGTKIGSTSGGSVDQGGSVTTQIGGNGIGSSGTSTSSSPVGVGGTTSGGETGGVTTSAGPGGTGGVTLGGTGGTTVGGMGGAIGGGGGTTSYAGNGGVAGNGGETCLTVVPDPLPAPCRGVPYDLYFTVRQGTPPYTWTERSAAKGLTLEQDGHIHGVVTEPTTLVARVTDKNGECRSDVSFDIKPRDKCHLAYISKDRGRAELHLYDPALHRHTSDPQVASQYTSHMFPWIFPSSGTAAVKDFKFSPSGKHLAYSLDTVPSRLALLTGPDWQETALEFSEGSVTAYAWSPDSSVLAVALGSETNPEKVLRGVRVRPLDGNVGGAAGSGGATNSPTSSVAGSPSVVEVTYLQPLGARIQSDLTWIDGGRLVAFHAPLDDLGSVTMVHVAQLTSSGFAEDIELDEQEYEGSVRIVGAEGGFWTVGSDRGVDYWALPEDPSVPVSTFNTHCHPHGNAYLAPSGRHTARVEIINDAPLLHIYDGRNERSPLAEPQKCPYFLGWSPENAGSELLACVATGADSRGSVVIFELSNSTLHQGSTVRGNYVYPQQDAAWYRRAFSPRGNWFAFGSSMYLYVASMVGGTPSQVPGEVGREGFMERVELAFSPNERWLLEHRANLLILHRLDGSSVTPYTINTEPLLQPETCTENPWSALEKWCGNAGTAMAPAWSADSQWAAFRKTGGVLQLTHVQTTPNPDASLPFSLQTSCTTDCVTQYAFQP